MPHELHTLPVALTLDEWQAVILAVALYAHAHIDDVDASLRLQDIQARVCAQVARRERKVA